MSEARESPLRYPCRFPIKVMGEAANGFETVVAALIRRHAPDLAQGAVSSRPSRGGRYLAVTVVIEAQSQAQVDAIYRELSAHPRVLMAL